MSDKALFEAIENMGTYKEIIYLAGWHESIAEDKSFHLELAKGFEQEYDASKELDDRRKRHRAIAKALYARAKKVGK